MDEGRQFLEQSSQAAGRVLFLRFWDATIHVIRDKGPNMLSIQEPR
jgi:hypothetical protein